MDPLFASLRMAATVPDLPEPTPEELAARRADLARRINDDIAAPMPPRVADDGVIRFPQCMLDAAGLKEIDGTTGEQHG